MSDKTAEIVSILLGGLITAAIMGIFFAAWWIWDNGWPDLGIRRTLGRAWFRFLKTKPGQRLMAWAEEDKR